MTFVFTLIVTIVFTSLFGFLWVLIHVFSTKQLGDRTVCACEIMDEDKNHSCSQFESCPEEIRKKCKYVK